MLYIILVPQMMGILIVYGLLFCKLFIYFDRKKKSMSGAGPKREGERET